MAIAFCEQPRHVISRRKGKHGCKKVDQLFFRTRAAVALLVLYVGKTLGIPPGSDWVIAPNNISHAVERTPDGGVGVWLTVTCVIRRSEKKYLSYSLVDQDAVLLLKCDNTAGAVVNEAGLPRRLEYASLLWNRRRTCAAQRSYFGEWAAYEFVTFKALMTDVSYFRRTSFGCSGVHSALKNISGYIEPVDGYDSTPHLLLLKSNFTPVVYPPMLTAGWRMLSFHCSIRSEPALEAIYFDTVPAVGGTYTFVSPSSCSKDVTDSVETCDQNRTLVSDGYNYFLALAYIDGARVTCYGRSGSTLVSAAVTVSNPDKWNFPSIEVNVGYSRTVDGRYTYSVTCFCAYVANVGATVRASHVSGHKKTFPVVESERNYAYVVTMADDRSDWTCSLVDLEGVVLFSERSAEDAGRPTAYVTIDRRKGQRFRTGDVVPLTLGVVRSLPFMLYVQTSGAANGCSWSPLIPATDVILVPRGTPVAVTASLSLVADLNDVQDVRCVAIQRRRLGPDVVLTTPSQSIPYADLAQRSRRCLPTTRNSAATTLPPPNVYVWVFLSYGLRRCPGKHSAQEMPGTVSLSWTDFDL